MLGIMDYWRQELIRGRVKHFSEATKTETVRLANAHWDMKY